MIHISNGIQFRRVLWCLGLRCRLDRLVGSASAASRYSVLLNLQKLIVSRKRRLRYLWCLRFGNCLRLLRLLLRLLILILSLDLGLRFHYLIIIFIFLLVSVILNDGPLTYYFLLAIELVHVSLPRLLRWLRRLFVLRFLLQNLGNLQCPVQRSRRDASRYLFFCDWDVGSGTRIDLRIAPRRQRQRRMNLRVKWLLEHLVDRELLLEHGRLDLQRLQSVPLSQVIGLSLNFIVF